MRMISRKKHKHGTVPRSPNPDNEIRKKVFDPNKSVQPLSLLYDTRSFRVIEERSVRQHDDMLFLRQNLVRALARFLPPDPRFPTGAKVPFTELIKDPRLPMDAETQRECTVPGFEIYKLLCKACKHYPYGRSDVETAEEHHDLICKRINKRIVIEICSGDLYKLIKKIKGSKHTK